MAPQQLKRAVLVLALLLAGCGEDEPTDIPPVREGVPRDAYVVPLGAAIATEPMGEDDTFRRLVTRRFTSVTPENEMKMVELQPERGKFDFEAADELLRYARETGKRVRGHTLIWDQQLPKWLTEGDWSRRELIEVLRGHVTRVVRHFKGRVAEWDVVNEPLNDAGGWEDTIWHEVIGPAYVGIAFRAARRADPDATLFLNEIAAERGRKAKALVRFMRFMKGRGVPVDAVGLQNHATVEAAPSERELVELGEQYGALGLGFAITELDVAAPGGDKGLQAKIYGDAARACTRLDNCTGVTVWGVKDDWSWLGEEARALPFDSEGRPKPAFGALLRTLRR